MGAGAARLFLTQMIAHHGQYRPAVAMARSIVSTQQQEIAAMKGILAAL